MSVYFFPPYARQGRLRGFTLIELMTAIIVISILAALLLTGFARVRGTARRTQCAANLKQINVAIQMYASDHDRRLPNMGYITDGLAVKCSWADRIYPYIRQTNIFECPQSSDYVYEIGCPPDSTMLDEDEMPYNFDGGYDLNRLSRLGHEFISEASLTHPTDTISILDGKGQIITPGFKLVLDAQALRTQVKPPRHGKGYNVLFADGHVSWKPETALLEQRLWWPQGKRPY